MWYTTCPRAKATNIPRGCTRRARPSCSIASGWTFPAWMWTTYMSATASANSSSWPCRRSWTPATKCSCRRRTIRCGRPPCAWLAVCRATIVATKAPVGCRIWTTSAPSPPAARRRWCSSTRTTPPAPFTIALASRKWCAGRNGKTSWCSRTRSTPRSSTTALSTSPPAPFPRMC